MARTSTSTRARTPGPAVPPPWPRRREREGGAPARVSEATERLPAVRPGSIPQQRPTPRQAPSPERAPDPGPDAVVDALLASVPPFGTPPYGTGRSVARPQDHRAAAPQGPRATAGPQPQRAAPGPAPQRAHRLAPAAPRNGFGIAALCLALVGLPFVLVPLGAVVAVLLGVPAIVLGLLGRARVRRGVATNRTLSLVGAALGLLTLAVGVGGLLVLARVVDAAAVVPDRLVGLLPVIAPAGAAADGPGYTFRLSGNAPGATVMWSVDGASGADQAARLPWTRTVAGRSDRAGSTTLTAITEPGSGGELTCSILGGDGRVLDTRTARSAAGSAGPSAVTCGAPD